MIKITHTHLIFWFIMRYWEAVGDLYRMFVNCAYKVKEKNIFLRKIIPKQRPRNIQELIIEDNIRFIYAEKYNTVQLKSLQVQPPYKRREWFYSDITTILVYKYVLSQWGEVWEEWKRGCLLSARYKKNAFQQLYSATELSSTKAL